MCTIVSGKYTPPFATLVLVQSAGGGCLYAGCDISLVITPSLPVRCPQLYVQIEEDNAFDGFVVAIWMFFIHVAVPCIKIEDYSIAYFDRIVV